LKRSRLVARAPGLAFVVALVTTSLPGSVSPVHAAPPAAEDRAETLFHEGKRLYDAGRYDEACARLQESDALDPAVGTLGLFAACEEKRGHLGQAMLAYREVARRARASSDARGAVADQRAKELEARIPRIVIEAPAGTRVHVAGREVTERGDQEPLRLDPGRVEILAKRQDGTTWSRSYDLAERASVVVVISEDDRAAPAAASVTGGEGGGPPIATFVLGGVGVVSLGVMTAFGVSAMSQNDASNDFQSQCETGDTTACASGKDAREGAETTSTLATVAFGASVAALAAAGVVWLLDDGGDEASASAAGAGAGAGRNQRQVDGGVRVVPGPGVAGLGLAHGF
jgi:hypothetical protein